MSNPSNPAGQADPFQGQQEQTGADSQQMELIRDLIALAGTEAEQVSPPLPTECLANSGKLTTTHGNGVNVAEAVVAQPSCPYHDPILRLQPKADYSPGTSPMWKFLSEGPSVQPSLFIRADTGKSTLEKGCRCAGIPEGKNGSSKD